MSNKHSNAKYEKLTAFTNTKQLKQWYPTFQYHNLTFNASDTTLVFPGEENPRHI